MPVCATRMATGLIPYSRKFNGIDIPYFGITTTARLGYHTYSSRGSTPNLGDTQAFSNFGNNQFHTI